MAYIPEVLLDKLTFGIQHFMAFNDIMAHAGTVRRIASNYFNLKANVSMMKIDGKPIPNFTTEGTRSLGGDFQDSWVNENWSTERDMLKGPTDVNRWYYGNGYNIFIADYM